MKKRRNKFETSTDVQLKQSGVRYTYETERIPYVLARHYIPDYILETRLGKIYIECKGYLRQADKSKMVAVKKQHPNLDIRILFYSYNRTYIRWAEKYGFRWAVDKIPKDWLDGL